MSAMMQIEQVDKMGRRDAERVSLRLRDPDAADRADIRDVMAEDRRRGWKNGKILFVLK